MQARGAQGAPEAAGPGATAASEAPAANRDPGGVDVVGRHGRRVRRTALIAVLTAVSRLLGYGREVLSALLFGDRSPLYDAFVTAWRVPNLFRRLLGEGAVSTSLQTALTETDADLGERAGRKLFWAVSRFALLLMIGICAVVMGAVALMGDRMPLTGWQWLGAEPAAVRELLLRVTPYVVFICLAGLWSGALAVRGHFTGASAGAGMMNLVAIATLVVIGMLYGWSGPSPDEGPLGYMRHLDMARLFSWGLLLSGALQLAILVPEMRRSGLMGPGRPGGQEPSPRFSAAKVVWSSAPLALGAAVYQVNVMVDGLMAQALLSAGGPTTYYFANRIQQLPMALVATAATSAVFPALKALAHKGDLRELRRIHDQTHLAIAFVMLPASLGLLVLAEPITAVLLQRGEFSAQGVERTASALAVLSLALLPASAIGLLGRAYFALGDFKTPVRISCLLLVVNFLLNALFLVVLGMDVAGLALATAIASWCNVLLLVPGLMRRLPRPEGVRFTRDLLRMLICGVLCAGAAWGSHRILGGDPRAAWQLFAAIAAGIAAYLLGAQALGVPEWAHVRARIARKLGI